MNIFAKFHVNQAGIRPNILLWNQVLDGQMMDGQTR